jgi:hypothetical protein
MSQLRPARLPQQLTGEKASQPTGKVRKQPAGKDPKRAVTQPFLEPADLALCLALAQDFPLSRAASRRPPSRREGHPKAALSSPVVVPETRRNAVRRSSTGSRPRRSSHRSTPPVRIPAQGKSTCGAVWNVVAAVRQPAMREAGRLERPHAGGRQLPSGGASELDARCVPSPQIHPLEISLLEVKARVVPGSSGPRRDRSPDSGAGTPRSDSAVQSAAGHHHHFSSSPK